MGNKGVQSIFFTFTSVKTKFIRCWDIGKMDMAIFINITVYSRQPCAWNQKGKSNKKSYNVESFKHERFITFTDSTSQAAAETLDIIKTETDNAVKFFLNLSRTRHDNDGYRSITMDDIYENHIRLSGHWYWNRRT